MNDLGRQREERGWRGPGEVLVGPGGVLAGACWGPVVDLVRWGAERPTLLFP